MLCAAKSSPMNGIVLVIPRSRFRTQVADRCSSVAFESQTSFLPRIAQNVIRQRIPQCSHVDSEANDDDDKSYDDLKAGSPIMIIEAPPYLKTAEPMPMMRPNGGAVMPGDAGRVIGRKPKDVWAIRVAAGAFLIERKYFKPLELK